MLKTAVEKTIQDNQIEYNKTIDELKAVIEKAEKHPKPTKPKAGRTMGLHQHPIQVHHLFRSTALAHLRLGMSLREAPA